MLVGGGKCGYMLRRKRTKGVIIRKIILLSSQYRLRPSREVMQTIVVNISANVMHLLLLLLFISLLKYFHNFSGLRSHNSSVEKSIQSLKSSYGIND